MPKPIVNEEKCTGCSQCVDVCPVDVFEMKDKKSKVANGDECIGCRACENTCPSDAIVVED